MANEINYESVQSDLKYVNQLFTFQIHFRLLIFRLPVNFLSKNSQQSSSIKYLPHHICLRRFSEQDDLYKYILSGLIINYCSIHYII